MIVNEVVCLMKKCYFFKSSLLAFRWRKPP